MRGTTSPRRMGENFFATFRPFTELRGWKRFEAMI
jgi:hypothetical protein